MTSIEFGLIAVPFLGLLMATMEMGFVFLANNNLDFAVRKAARTITTGSAQAAGVSTADQFRTQYICPPNRSSLWSFIDCTKLIIDVRSSTDFSSADLSNDFYKTQSTNQFCPGAPSTITVVRVAYPMPYFLPILQGFKTISVNATGLVNDVPNNPGWKHLLVSTSIFQTEPYSGTYTNPSGCS